MNAAAMTVTDMPVHALRGTLVWFRDDPFIVDPSVAMRVEMDGIVAMARAKSRPNSGAVR